MRFAPNKVFELMDGTKVGVFGLTTPETLTTVRPTYTEPFTFLELEDLFACAQKQVVELRQQGADLVVCLGHLGNIEAVGQSTSKDVLANVEGIDLFIDGHDHQLVEEEVAGTLLVETGCYMRNLGLVVIDAGVPKNQGIAYGDYDGKEKAAQAIIDDIRQQVEKELSVVLASTPFTLLNDKPEWANEEMNLGDLVADALLNDAQRVSGLTVDGALINMGAIRTSIEEGDITLNDVKTVAPFSDSIVVLRIGGAQLLEAIEAASQSVGFGTPISAFPQVAGIEFSINATVPYEKGDNYPDSTFASPKAPGARVTIHTVGGKEFDESATYAIATNDFLAQGGDTYYQFKVAAEKETPITCDHDYECIVSYLIGPLDHEVPERYKEPQGRITIIEK